MRRGSRGAMIVSRAVLALAMASTAGCAAGLSLSAAPTVDTTGHFGTEERAHVFAGVGTENLRYFIGVAGGVGYQDGYRSGHATVSPEMGVEGGQDLLWGVDLSYTPRILFKGPLDVAHGGGVGGQVLFGIKRMGGEHGRLLIGPRLSAEVAQEALSTDGDQRTIGLFSLGIVLRYTMFDTTGNRW